MFEQPHEFCEDDSYYLPAGLIGEDTPPQVRKSSAPVQLEPSLPPGISSVQNRASWGNAFGMSNNSYGPSEWQSPWTSGRFVIFACCILVLYFVF